MKNHIVIYILQYLQNGLKDKVMLKVLKITSLQNPCNISRKKWGMKLIFGADKHQVDTILFDGFGLSCPKYAEKFAISLRYLKKECRNILIFGMCVDLLPMGIISFICQSNTITNN